MLQEKVIAILTPKAKKIRPPNHRPIARAIHSLHNHGITAIFGVSANTKIDFFVGLVLNIIKIS